MPVIGAGATPQEVALMLNEVATNLERKIESLSQKLEKYETSNSENLRKLTVLISELYQQGKINEDTFNRLDEFLHDWLDSTIDSEP